MGLRELSAFQASTQGINKSLQNLTAIRQSKQRAQQEKELFDLNKQKAELELKSLKMKNEVSPMELKLRESMLSAAMEDFKKIQKGKEAQLDLAESSQYNTIDKLTNIAESTAKDDLVSGLLLGKSMQLGAYPGDLPDVQNKIRNINPNLPAPTTFEMNDKANLSEIMADPLKAMKMKSQENKAPVYKQDKAGNLTKSQDVEKGAIIVKTDSRGDIALPDYITDEKTAAKFLMSQGLSKEEAIQKIKDLR